MPNCTQSARGSSNISCVLLEVSGTPQSTEEVLAELGPLISDEMRLKLEIVLQISLFTVTSLFGTVANVINITVYWKQGLRDSITVGLFALSISDFFVIFFPLFTAGCYLADHLYPGSPIMFKAIAGVSATQTRHLFYSLSCTLTAFLSIERCFCVVRPFRVKLIFTRRRTVIVIISMVVFYVLAFFPLFFTHQLRWQPDRRRNGTEVLTLWHHPAAQYVIPYNSSLMSITIPTTAQVIVTCTAAIMIGGLRKASRFRRSATDSGMKKDISTKNESTNEKKDPMLKSAKREAIGQGLDPKDARLVKTMLILVTILSVANIPYISLKYTQLIVPEMNPRKRYQNTFRLIASINFLLGSMNASVNALVYYVTGSRYREIFNSLFSRKNPK